MDRDLVEFVRCYQRSACFPLGLVRLRSVLWVQDERSRLGLVWTRQAHRTVMKTETETERPRDEQDHLPEDDPNSERLNERKKVQQFPGVGCAN